MGQGAQTLDENRTSSRLERERVRSRFDVVCFQVAAQRSMANPICEDKEAHE